MRFLHSFSRFPLLFPALSSDDGRTDKFDLLNSLSEEIRGKVRLVFLVSTFSVIYLLFFPQMHAAPLSAYPVVTPEDLKRFEYVFLPSLHL